MVCDSELIWRSICPPVAVEVIGWLLETGGRTFWCMICRM